MGPEPATVFNVHEGLVRASSEFFDKAMRRDWKEATDRVVKLPNDDPTVFRLYVHWLYSGTLPCQIDEPNPTGNLEYLQLAKAHVLGIKLLVKRFADATVDAIIEKAHSIASDGHSWFPDGEAIRYLYANTLPSSPVRRLLVDFYVSCGNKDWVAEWDSPEERPSEFLFDLAVGLYEKQTCVNPLQAEPCAYHQHELDSTECYNHCEKIEGEKDDKAVNGST